MTEMSTLVASHQDPEAWGKCPKVGQLLREVLPSSIPGAERPNRAPGFLSPIQISAWIGLLALANKNRDHPVKFVLQTNKSIFSISTSQTIFGT
jgi:hypothetical protein